MQNDLIGNFELAVYRLCKNTSENLPTFEIEDDEDNDNHQVADRPNKVKREKRKIALVKGSQRLEKKCKTISAPDFPTSNYEEYSDIEPTLEDIDLIQLMTDLTTVDQTGCYR